MTVRKRTEAEKKKRRRRAGVADNIQGEYLCVYLFYFIFYFIRNARIKSYI